MSVIVVFRDVFLKAAVTDAKDVVRAVAKNSSELVLHVAIFLVMWVDVVFKPGVLTEFLLKSTEQHSVEIIGLDLRNGLHPRLARVLND